MSEELRAKEVSGKDLIELLINLDKNKMTEVLEDIHPEDLLDALRNYEEDKSILLRKLPEVIIVSILDQAQDDEKANLLKLLPEEVQKNIINEMSSDELVDLLGALTPQLADELLVKFDQEEVKKVKQLMSYDPQTAGGIMATEFIAVKENMTVKETLKYLQQEAPQAETAYYLYVLDDEKRLKGVVALRDIVINEFDVVISSIINEHVISVSVDMDQEEVGHYFEKYGFLLMPVVDNDGRMLGIITVDDIIRVVREEDTEDIYRLAGIGEGERIDGSIRNSVRIRLPWLFVNLLTALMAAATVKLFEGTIEKVVALATFMPIVAGMGGNTGTQTLTIVVRSIALGELTGENAKKVLFKEVSVGILSGLSIGLASGVLGFLLEDAIFGFVIGAAMILNMAVATFSGYVIPVVLKKLKVDPALASAVFVTTVTDVLGFFFFLGLATLFLMK